MRAYKGSEGDYFTFGESNTSVCIPSHKICVQTDRRTGEGICCFRVKKIK